MKYRTAWYERDESLLDEAGNDDTVDRFKLAARCILKACISRLRRIKHGHLTKT